MQSENHCQNIILLSIDCLRADHISGYGYHRNTTPYLDELINKGDAFKKAYSASSHTPEAIPALISGQPPDIFSDNEYIFTEKSVAGYLNSEDWMTSGFHSNVNISQIFGYGDEFDTYYDDLFQSSSKLFARLQRKLQRLIFNRPMYYARAEKINKEAASWWNSNSTNETSLFLWAHYMDVHGPYDPETQYFGTKNTTSKENKTLFRKAIESPKNITSEEKNKLVDLYDSEIKYIDNKIESLITTLQELENLYNTMIIITADHGDGFGEHGYFNHPRHLHDELLHIPLIIVEFDENGEIKDSDSGIVDNVAVSSLDIAPTILYEAEVSEKKRELPGEPLQNILASTQDYENRCVFSSVRGEGSEADIRRFRATTASTSSMLQVKIRSGEISDYGTQTSGNLDSSLRGYIRSREDSNTSRNTKKPSNIDSKEVDERLEALGYK